MGQSGWMRIVGSVTMGLFTMGLFGLVVMRLHPGPAKDMIGQIAFKPSMLLAHLFYAGADPASPPAGWTLAFDGSGVLFYSVIWYVLLSVAATAKGKH
ncbi:MAG: hypothetical protein WA414_13880 [Acidobacteriaceae bacterium]